ncbi:Homeodomain protein [Pseudocohnilembus persalinus]|uniref:Homeodomain protein n=1 Tax=Pseudocohnilembus persalinus TaxID=266149 RepID=A0A0V0QYW8_PSEPJ|nr:Homeodomain protein [Pseudocohnilembus persalinus]|eukprot:KRX07435.1 Homeodomain protein [Pseudocohnilembus persalinus]
METELNQEFTSNYSEETPSDSCTEIIGNFQIFTKNKAQTEIKSQEQQEQQTVLQTQNLTGQKQIQEQEQTLKEIVGDILKPGQKNMIVKNLSHYTKNNNKNIYNNNNIEQTVVAFKVNSRSFRQNRTGENNMKLKYWSKEEINQFDQLLLQFGTDFTAISYIMKSKTRNQVRARYNKQMKSNF